MCEHAVVRTPSVQNKSLMPSGKPSSGPPCPFASRASDARAMSRARSGVSSTKALSARASAMAARCASASSIAENSLLRRPSRACASVSAVRSVIRWSDRHTKMGFWPQALVPYQAPQASARPNRPAPATAASGNRQTAFQLPPDRRGSAIPCSPDRRARWRLVHRPCTWLFHHLGDDEEVILMSRSVGDDGIRDAAVGHLILAHFHRHRRHRRHRFDAVDVDLGKLLDEGENRVELALKASHLVLGNGDPRQMRNAADRICVDSHKNLTADSNYAPIGVGYTRAGKTRQPHRKSLFRGAVAPPQGAIHRGAIWLIRFNAAFSAVMRIASIPALRIEQSSA